MPFAPGADVEETAVAAFLDRYGPSPEGPVVAVVIAALNEEQTVGDVVRSVPAALAGLATECIVVDDGSSDHTAREAEEAGAMVCRLARNVGQGRALRAGYAIATTRQAQVIVTLDADGQFEPSEAERLVAPLIDRQADFVNGSRRLGRSESTDPLRRAGVVAFATLISALTGTRITDPANGFRAFRPEVVDAVPLRQPQYQTAELLIGALSAGFRVVEAPVTVLARKAGTSKKGANLLYGARFARVVATTWWSARALNGSRSPTPAPEVSPAAR